ncbi:ABC transporter ATP-binding protein [Halalkalicoccus subterraneus]|uniref:ABC transporter ATP-binding protein n=1 Tax=Halalkalicoccus subterraneus TaxID=2675002 RepID=UPI000EFBCB21|nr:ABC transporter ATP-binding protein [Halalkalicoccus subterraneus]
MAAIELRDVSKRYDDSGGLRPPGSRTSSDDVVAVDGLDLTVREGEVFGFLGPNGAGKSTTIDMILDFVHPSQGSIEVLGYDAHEESLAVRKRTGVLPEGFDVYDRLTGRKHVELAVDSKGASDDPDALLKRVGIADAADRKAGDYSKGMTQRLALAMALVGEPDLLVLDEPSTGLDPNGALEMREIIREEVARGATVFFSSHILGQVDAVCDRVGILREGRLVAEDSVAGLREAAGTDTTLRITVGELPSRAVDRVRALDGVSGVEQDGSVLRVGVESGSKTAVLSALESEGAEVRDFETEEASLEDLFRAYTEGGR